MNTKETVQDHTEYSLNYKRSIVKSKVMSDEMIYRSMINKVVNGLRLSSLKELFELSKVDAKSKEVKDLLADEKLPDDVREELELLSKNHQIKYTVKINKI